MYESEAEYYVEVVDSDLGTKKIFIDQTIDDSGWSSDGTTITTNNVGEFVIDIQINKDSEYTLYPGEYDITITRNSGESFTHTVNLNDITSGIKNVAMTGKRQKANVFGLSEFSNNCTYSLLQPFTVTTKQTIKNCKIYLGDFDFNQPIAVSILEINTSNNIEKVVTQQILRNTTDYLYIVGTGEFSFSFDLPAQLSPDKKYCIGLATESYGTTVQCALYRR